MARFRIKDLPLELRLEIYEYVLAVDMSDSVASFQRPIPTSELDDWIDRPLISATNLRVLQECFPEVNSIRPRHLTHGGSALYVEHPALDWLTMARNLELKHAMLDFRSCTDTPATMLIPFIHRLADAVFRHQITAVLMSKSAPWSYGKQLWSCFHFGDDTNASCFFAHLDGVWKTKRALDVPGRPVVLKEDWVQGWRIMRRVIVGALHIRDVPQFFDHEWI